ncbi:MAG: OPT/YSL family transporter [Myxococcales bacterium]|nr:OPT/YSL family transporter [Myxococcales bacterium]
MSSETPEAPYREITFAGVALGVVVGVVMTVSFTYAGLKLGFTVPASMVSAMLGWGVLRGLLKKGSIVENNINQTVAAAINVSSAGVIFTVPVLYLFQAERARGAASVAASAQRAGQSIEQYVASHPELQSIDPKFLWAMAGASVAGALLGVLFIIPSRKQMIELERLVFPTGVATATILKASASGARRARMLMWGIVSSVLFATFVGLPGVVKGLPWPAIEDFSISERLHLPAWFAITIAVSGGLTSIGGGYITGRAGLVLMVGAVIGHWIVTPAVVTQGWLPDRAWLDVVARAGSDVDAARTVLSAHGEHCRAANTCAELVAVGQQLASGAHGHAPRETANTVLGAWAYRNVTRPLGVGMLLGGSIASVILTAPVLLAAIKSVRRARAQSGSKKGDGPEELDPKLMYTGVATGFVILVFAAWMGVRAVGTDSIGVGSILLASAIATAWMWLANIIVSITTGKTDNSPLSGMALITILLILTALGRSEAGVMVAMVMAVAVCVATGQGSDMMQDLKTGHLVGALPRRQQLTQLVVAWVGPLVSLVTLFILAKKFVLGNDPLTAPQAQAIKAAIELLAPAPDASVAQQALAEATRLRYAVGAAVGLTLTLGVGGGLGVVLGLSMYLPMSVTLTYFIGCVITVLTEKRFGKEWVEERGVPLAAGWLVGEGLAQVVLVGVDLARVAAGGR